MRKVCRLTHSMLLAGLAGMLLSLAVITGAAQGTAGQAGAFLKLGMEARALGMGSAYTAVCRDAAAGYWNPAGLGLVTRQQVTATYTVFPESGEYSQIAYALPLSEFDFPEDNMSGSPGRALWGTVGITILRYAAAYNIEARETDALNPDYFFSDIEGSYGIAYGRLVWEKLYVGLGIKGFYHQLDQAAATGGGIDAGLIWQGFPDFTGALAVRDAYSQLNWSTGYREVFPAVLKGGLAWQRTFGKQHSIILEIDVSHNLTTTPVGLHVGMEYGFHKILFLRLGYNQEQCSYGGGVRIPWIGWGRAALLLDYAACEDRIVGWDHWFSVKLEF